MPRLLTPMDLALPAATAAAEVWCWVNDSGRRLTGRLPGIGSGTVADGVVG